MKVFIAGCFDVLTVAHINMLLFARQIAGPNGIVTVSLDSDAKMALEKRPPIFRVSERCDAIEALTVFGSKAVNTIFIHNDNDHLHKSIVLRSPDYIVVGSDYKEKEVVGSDIAKVIFFERDQRFSSTKIIAACRK